MLPPDAIEKGLFQVMKITAAPVQYLTRYADRTLTVFPVSWCLHSFGETTMTDLEENISAFLLMEYVNN